MNVAVIHTLFDIVYRKYHRVALRPYAFSYEVWDWLSPWIRGHIYHSSLWVVHYVPENVPIGADTPYRRYGRDRDKPLFQPGPVSSVSARHFGQISGSLISLSPWWIYLKKKVCFIFTVQIWWVVFLESYVYYAIFLNLNISKTKTYLGSVRATDGSSTVFGTSFSKSLESSYFTSWKFKVSPKSGDGIL